MPLQDHLLGDETILASSRASAGGLYASSSSPLGSYASSKGGIGSGAVLYATNKRVIRYAKGLFGEKVNSLYYPHIVGTEYESHSFRWVIALGITVIFLGAILDWYHVELGASSFEGNVAFLFLCVFGALMVLLGIFQKPLAFYRIKATGLTEKELALWRTANAEPEAKAFASFVQGQISMREIPPPPPPIEREVITREVVMIKCEYCGALMPQTSTFCPNCGARRQS